MKMKNLLLSLTLAGLCGASVSATQTNAQEASRTGAQAARHIGDGVRSIGDSNRYVASSADVRPEEFKPKATLAAHAMTIAPTATSCDVSCDTGCSTISASCCSEGNSWFSAESLLWFGARRKTPALVTTSAQGVLPVAGATGVTTVFGGGDGIDGGLLPGYRVSAGTYLDDCKKIGVGGRAYGLFNGTESYSNASNGDPSIGIPFFNTSLTPPADDAYLVAFTLANGNPVSVGSVEARSDLDMVGADGSLHLLLAQGSGHRIDMLAGYTFNSLKNSVSLTTQSTDLFTGNVIPDGTVFDTNDTFATENIFHGAHLGVLSSVVRNKISLSTLAKISFGNMRQTSTINGSTTSTLNGVSTFDPRGIFAQPSNIGVQTRDQFAFIPELGLKLGYQANCNLRVTVGYTFMMWSAVALAGEQMDSTVNILGTGTRPRSVLNDSAYWMQGIDLGMTYSF